MRITRVTIVKEKQTPRSSINDLLLVFGESLGLFSQRDKDKSCYRIFIVMVKALKMKKELSSDEIASQTGLSRGTVIHHLNRLMDAGIVTNSRGKYFINYDSLQDLVVDMRESVNELLNNLDKTAKQIDVALNL